LLEEILTLAPDTKVIVLTGQNDRANALRAIALGAYDFFAKPFEIDMLGLTIQRAYRLHELQKENERLQSMQQPDVLSGLITRDPELLRVCRTDRAGWRHRCDGVAARRKRHRQGTSGARECMSRRRVAASASWPSTARPFRTTCWKANSLVTRKGLSPGLPNDAGQDRNSQQRHADARRDR
jgi:chemotaxis response regulator CheB